MNTLTYDFQRMGSLMDFYRLFKNDLPEDQVFGSNLDALYDVLTAGVALPLRIEFINMTLPQLEQFDDLLTVMVDAMEESAGQLEFVYFIQQ